MNKLYFKAIISACQKKHSDIFKIAFEKLLLYVPFKTLHLVVPDEDWQHFYDLYKDNKMLILYKDSYFISSRLNEYIKNKLCNESMYGWYIQQLIKIKLSSNFDDMDNILIWDSDTIPLRPLNFIRNDGDFNYYYSSEFHKPYFSTLKNLGIDKVTPHSFIAQNFPLKSIYAKDFIDFIENIDDKYWMETLIDNLDQSSDCAFSEYESLGNFILTKKDLNFIDFPWERNGSVHLYKFRSIEKAIVFLEKNYAFVAFENIKLSKAKKLIYRVLDLFKGSKRKKSGIKNS